MEQNDSKIEFIEDGSMFNEEKKLNRKILAVVFSILAVAILLVVFSVSSAMNCTNDAKKQTDEYFRIGDIIDKNGSLTGVKATREQVYTYNLNQCVKKVPLASRQITSFSVSFLLETLLLFLFLWLATKVNKVSAIMRATILAFYFSLIFSLGISVFIVGAIVGWGFVPRVLKYSAMQSFFLMVGLIATQYGIMYLLLNFI
ncbi:MAG: hypothetical protein WCI36_00385 [bacterium]